MTAPAAAPPRSFLEAQEIFEHSLPGYARRENQIALAGKVEEAIAEGLPAFLQAGTGTGKSFALLIPAILAAKHIVVATATKALQNQYFRNDLPWLQEHLGVSFTYAMIKGRSNYPCRAKARDITDPTAGQQQVLARMAELDGTSEVIDREDFPLLPEEEWKPFSMSATECPGKNSCPFGEKCFAEAAKRKAAAADIVVTNIAYLLRDLILRQETEGTVALLGELGQVIVDEAHVLPDAATSALEDTMGEGTFIRLALDMSGYLEAEEEDPQIALEIERATRSLWDVLAAKYTVFIARAQNKSDPVPLTASAIISEPLGGPFIDLYQAIKAAREAVKNTTPPGERGKIARYRLIRRAGNQMDRLLAFTTDEQEKTVRWISQKEEIYRGKKQVTLWLRSAPVSVAPFLRTALWDQAPVIMSSATLSAGKDSLGKDNFSYLASTVGLEMGEVLTFSAGSSFDYQKQTLMFVPPKGTPEPSGKTSSSWPGYARSAALNLVTASGGGALLLYTSRKAMNDAYQALAPQFARMGLLVLKQGDMTVPELVGQFREDGNAVLFALRTLFEGIDIPGKALRLVVLDKLPFAVPSDLVYAARAEAINKACGDDWASFTQLAIPTMILILTQAFGRLIRRIDDQGCFAILDARLASKGYGPGIVKALPPARRTGEIGEAMAYLEGLR